MQRGKFPKLMMAFRPMMISEENT